MRKIASFLCGILCFALMLGLMSLPAAAASGLWSADVDDSWYKDYSTSPTFNINSAKQIAYLAKLVNDGTNDFQGIPIFITQNIDLSAHYWVPIGTPDHPFKGTINGNGNTISGIQITTDSAAKSGSDRYYGFIGCSEGGEVSNLTLTGSIDVTGAAGKTDIVGSAVAKAAHNNLGSSGNSVVSRLTSSITIINAGTAGNMIIGGMVGQAAGAKLSGCVNNGTITVTGTPTVQVGGLIGAVTVESILAGNIQSGPSRNNAALSVAAATADVGGTVGKLEDATLFMTSSETGTDADAGFIWSTGDLTVEAATANVGGFIGSITGTGVCNVSGAVFTRDITVSGTNANVGGILGSQTASVKSVLTNCSYRAGLKVIDNNYRVLIEETNSDPAISVTSTGTVYTGGIYGSASKLEVAAPVIGEADLEIPVTISSNGTVGGIGSIGTTLSTSDVFLSGTATVGKLQVEALSENGFAGGVFGKATGLPGFTMNADTIEVSSVKKGVALGGVAGSLTDGASSAAVTVTQSLSLYGEGEGSKLGGFAGSFTGTADTVSLVGGEIVLECDGAGSYLGGIAGQLTGSAKTVSLTADADVALMGDGANSFFGGIAGELNGTAEAVTVTAADKTISLSGDGEGSRFGGVFGRFVGTGTDVNAKTIGLATESISIVGGGKESRLGGMIGDFKGKANGFTMTLAGDADESIMITAAGEDSILGGMIGDADGDAEAFTMSVAAATAVVADEEDCYIGGMVGRLKGKATAFTQNLSGNLVVQGEGDGSRLGGMIGVLGGSANGITVAADGQTITVFGDGDNSFIGGTVGFLPANSASVANVGITAKDIIVSGNGESSYLGGVAGVLNADVLGTSTQQIQITAETITVTGAGAGSRLGGLAGAFSHDSVSRNAKYIKVDVDSIMIGGDGEDSRLGGLTATFKGDAENITVNSDTITVFGAGKKAQLGGLVGAFSGNAKDVAANVGEVDVEAAEDESKLGGLTGTFTGTAKNVTFKADAVTVTGAGDQSQLGGLSGTFEGEAKTIEVNAKTIAVAVEGGESQLGGLAGTFAGTATDVTLQAADSITVTGVAYKSQLGGAVGTFSGVGASAENITVSAKNLTVQAISDGTANLSECQLGGVAGSFAGTAENLTLQVTEKLTVSSAAPHCQLGGVAGSFEGELDTAVLTLKTVNVKGGAQSAIGGAFGSFTGTAAGITANVSREIAVTGDGGDSYLGGITGRFDGDSGLSDVSITGKITVKNTGDNSLLGTIAGTAENLTLDTTQMNVTATLSSTGEKCDLGGIIGTFGGEVDGSTLFVVGTIDVTNKGDYGTVGGFAAENVGALKNVNLGDRVYLRSSDGDSCVMGGLAGTNTAAGVIDFCFTAAELHTEGATTALSKAYQMTMGGLVGVNLGTVKNSFRDMDVTMTSVREGMLESVVGGLIGSMGAGKVERCYTVSNVDVTNVTKSAVVAGGLIGRLSGGSVENCYTAEKQIIGRDSASTIGGFVGEQQGGTLTQCYSAMHVDGGEVIGGFYGSYVDGDVSHCIYLLDNTANINFNMLSAGQGFPPTEVTQLSAFGVEAMSGTEVFSDWTVADIWRFGTTDGRANPYPELIREPADGKQTLNYDIRWYTGSPDDESFSLLDESDLAGFTMLVNGGLMGVNGGDPLSFTGKTISIDAPINIQTAEWIPIGIGGTDFVGKIEGNENIITGLTVKDGLFTHINKDAKLKNVWIETLGISGPGNVGVLAPTNDGMITAPVILVKGEITTDSGSAGGVVGVNNTGKIIEPTVTVEAAIKGSANAGGVAGGNTNVITQPDVTLSAEISASAADSSAGGVAGALPYGCTMESPKLAFGNGAVIKAGAYAGGVVGRNDGTISDVTFAYTEDGAVEIMPGSTYAGGLIGFNDEEASVSYSEIELKGLVTAKTYAGGLVGCNKGTISDGVLTLNAPIVATADAGYAGGVVGKSTGTVGSVALTVNEDIAAVGAASYAGALAGYVSDVIDDTSVSLNAAISAMGYAGGVVGDSAEAISGVTVEMADKGSILVTGDGGYAGGVAGRCAKSIENTDVVGAVVSGTAYTGGLAGSCGKSIANVSVVGGTVSGTGYTGGVVGQLAAGSNTIENVRAESLEISGSGKVGGLVGEFYDTVAGNSTHAVSASELTITATDADYVGGVFGRVSGGLDYVIANDVTITETQTGTAASYIGGIAGYAEKGLLHDVTAYSIELDVDCTTADIYCGGLAAKLSVADGEQGIDTADISALTIQVNPGATDAGTRNAYIGGLCGEMINGRVYYTAVAGDILAGGFDKLTAGGAMGSADGVLFVANSTDCGPTSDLAMSFEIGGFAGSLINTAARYNYAASEKPLNVEQSNTGTAKRYLYVGGFVGRLENTTANLTFSDNYAAQQVTVNSVYEGANIYAGGFAGTISGTKALVSACYATESCTVNGMAYGYAGGFTGKMEQGRIESCFASGETVSAVSKFAWSGGFVGDHAGGTIKDCYAVNDMVLANGTETALVGAIVGKTTGTIESSYGDTADISVSIGEAPAKTVIIPETTQALNAGEHLTGFDFESASPAWGYLPDVNGNRPVLTAIDRWDAWPDIEMIRTQTSTDYTPIDAAQLGTVARLMNDPTLAALLRLTPPEVGTITLTGDIDLSEKLWTPISELKAEGVLDGQNHSITGLYGGSAGYENYGLVKTNRGTIKDLTINGAGVTAGTIAGTVAGTNAGTITNVSVSGAELTTTGKAGGVVGVNESTGTMSGIEIADDVAVTGTTAGGIAGENLGTISEATTAASVQTSNAGDTTVTVGGAVGANGGTMTKIDTSATVKGATAGGVAGVNRSGAKIENEIHSGANVTGSVAAGGIVGKNMGTVGTSEADSEKDVISEATVEAPTVGGVAGVNDAGTIQNSDTTSAEDQIKGGATAKGRIVGTGTYNTDNCHGGTCADPVASPTERGFLEKVTVTLSTTTEGASIYYSIGKDVEPYVLYTDPIELNKTTVINAITVMPGMYDSKLVSVTYSKPVPYTGGVSIEEEEPETYEIPASVGDASVALTAEIEEGVATIVEAELDPVLDTKETGAVTFDVCALEEEIVSIVIPADVIRQLADAAADETSGVNGLEVLLPDGTVKLDAEALAEAAESGADIAVAVEHFDDDSFSVQVLTNGKRIETPVKVELTDVPEGQVLALVAADGSVTPIKKSLIDGGKAYALVESGTTVKAIDAALAFPDVPESKWYKSAVDFVSSHGLFQGTNNGFEPSLYMNRAMLATVLYRLEDAAAEGTNPFEDIAAGTWYTDAVIWASENGIVNGTGTGFQPMRNVTREQIATMLFRYAKYLGLDTGASSALDAFPDGSETADWAREAMQWAVSVGLFQGNTDGSLNPKGDATRAEVAALMQRMVGLIVK